MKISIPGTILATSLNLGPLINEAVPQGAVATNLPEEARQSAGASITPNVASVFHESDEFYTTIQEFPVDIEWDKNAEKRFQSLAAKEALETLNASELVELEALTNARRKHTAPAVSTRELLEELRQWQSVNRVFEALARYVEEIGLKRKTVTNRP